MLSPARRPAPRGRRPAADPLRRLPAFARRSGSPSPSPRRRPMHRVPRHDGGAARIASAAERNQSGVAMAHRRRVRSARRGPAATCARTVSCPCPCELQPSNTLHVPRGSIAIRAPSNGPNADGSTRAAMPRPRRIGPGARRQRSIPVRIRSARARTPAGKSPLSKMVGRRTLSVPRTTASRRAGSDCAGGFRRGRCRAYQRGDRRRARARNSPRTCRARATCRTASCC